MFFVSGLSLLAIGIGLATHAETVTRNTKFNDPVPPYQVTVHPYDVPGVILIIFGIFFLFGAFFETHAEVFPAPIPPYP